MPLFSAPLRALGQMDDPVFWGVVWRSVLWTLAGFVAVAGLLDWGVHAAFSGSQWFDWLGAVLGGVGAALLALYLFLPMASVVAFLFSDRIAAAVERRYYPFLPPARPAPLAQQIWDSIALGLRVLAWQLVALLLVVTPLAPVAVPVGWVVAAWSIGRGLFVAVAMRRMDRPQAAAAYLALRPSVLGQGALMAVASVVPLLNLLIPVLGTAAMVHVLHAPREPDGVATPGRL
jgi:uncharacterized protein involved in cysteine biosynthesis